MNSCFLKPPSRISLRDAGPESRCFFLILYPPRNITNYFSITRQTMIKKRDILNHFDEKGHLEAKAFVFSKIKLFFRNTRRSCFPISSPIPGPQCHALAFRSLARSLCLSRAVEEQKAGKMRGPLGAIIGRYPTSGGGGGGGGGDGEMRGGIIRKNRKCRDLVFLVIFIAFWVAMIVNSSFGFNQGNPLRY